MRQEFLTDIETLRARAREHISLGPITEAYGADRDRVCEVLNEALATEIVCVLRYKRHYFTASGINSTAVAQEFLQHANEEQTHADRIAQRIVQLGGEPDLSPQGLATRAHSEYDASLDLLEMVREDLVAERIAIASYTEIVQWLGHKDPTTRRLMEDILANEEEHADDLLNILQEMGGPSASGGAASPGGSDSGGADGVKRIL
jgi:bacterioferritin